MTTEHPPYVTPPRPAPLAHRLGFTLPEVADGLGVTVETVRAWIRAGRVAAIGTERRRVVTAAALDAAFGADVARAMLTRARVDGAPVLDDTARAAPPGE